MEAFNLYAQLLTLIVRELALNSTLFGIKILDLCCKEMCTIFISTVTILITKI